jgi:hypothetical protein
MKNGRLRSTSFDMNLFSAVILPVSLYISFLDRGGFMCTIVLIFFRLALILFTDTRHPSTLPLFTSKTHFFGISFSWVLRIFVKVSARSSIYVAFFLLATTMSST